MPAEQTHQLVEHEPSAREVEVQDYLELLSAGASGYLTFLELPARQHTWFHTSDLASAAAHITQAADGRTDIYVRSGIQSHAGGTKAGGLGAMTMISLDFDLAGPGHKSERLPTSASDLDVLLEKADVPSPTLTLNTGGGLLAVWRFEEPFVIGGPEDLSVAEGLARRFQGHIRQVARSLGWHVDATHDLVRAFRIPGTRNWKPAYGPEGAEVSMREPTGAQVSLDEVRRVAALYEDAPQHRPRQTPRTREASIQADAGRRPLWLSIYNACDALRAWADVGDGLSEPEWYALAGIVGHCEDSAETFKGLSSDDHRYVEAEAMAKVDQAAQASPPRLCSSISDLEGDCGHCPFRGLINSPIALGYIDPVVAQLARRWTYVADLDGFVDLFEIEGSAA